MYLIHAYSRNNSGDGLLVDLSIGIIKELNSIQDDIIEVVALDGRSFSDLDIVHELPIANANTLLARCSVSITTVIKLLIPQNPNPDIFDLKEYTPIFAVGGGYQRNKNIIESIKFTLAHLPQLKMASNHTGPVVYLPQSIGPLKGIVGWYTRKLLKKVGMIFVRDTRSYELLKKDGCNVFQVPDLAVQEVFNKQKVANQLIKSRKVYLIARDVDSINRKAYIRRLKVLIEQIPGIEPIVQSSGRGNNDSDFYMSLGLNGPYRSVREALEYESGVVVSVRLHGAIESIIAGCPTIHLSYERKGFSAYEDLNIKDYVHNYRSFIPDRVAFQIDELINDSSNYWAALEKSSAEVRDKRSFMLKTINNYLEGEF